jgi:uncharacterized membrane protein YkvA (DUF1232 family)
MKNFVVFCLGLAALIYLLNPGAGLFEILPDNLPLVGNLDEAAAMALLAACLRHFGIRLPGFFRKNGLSDKPGDDR